MIPIPTIVYNRCLEIVAEAKRRGFDYQIPRADLIDIIKRIGGTNKLTIKSYLQELQYFKIVKTESGTVYTFVESEANAKDNA